jgi:hypothetical protein
MLCHRADVVYLSGQYEAAVDSLTWIERLTAEQPPSKDISGEWTSLHQIVQCRLAQLAAGLDFYGFPKNYVPLVKFTAFAQPISDMIGAATDIELQYSSYYKVNSDQKAQTDAMHALLNASLDSIKTIDADLKALGTSTDAVQDSLASLTDALQAQQLALQSAAFAFRQAVERQVGGECKFLDAVLFVATVVSLATSAYADAVAIVSAAKALSTVSTVKDLVVDIQTAANDINDLRVKFSNIKTSVANLSNSSKIAMAQADVDALLGNYRNLPEAREYQAELDTFFSTCLTRSQKALDLTGMFAQQGILTAQRAARTQEIARLDALLVKDPNPTLPAYVGFLAKLLSETKRRLVLALYEEHRAFQYWSLTDVPFNVESYDLGVLSNLHSTIQTDALQAQINRNRPLESFGAKLPIVVALSAKEYPTAFAQFAKTNTLTFAIPFDDPAFRVGVYGISLSQVAISIIGLQTEDGRASVGFVHHGHARFLSQAKTPIVFSHDPRRTQFIYDLKTGTAISDQPNNLGQDGTFAGLSPFATWTLSVDPAANAKPKLDAVTAVELSFGGYFAV